MTTSTSTPAGRRADRLEATVADLHELARTGPKFGTIYADPPWAYKNKATRASAASHYPTMSLAELAELPVADLAAPSCHLHLWTTNAFLFEAPKIMDAWGFEYQDLFVWCKPQLGLGNYWRVSHEFLLLGVRGELRHFQARDLRSWGGYKRDRHSSKPEQVRLLIERASPGPRLELFARRQAPGWWAWGNEIERDLFHATGEAV
jgi:N6-adenosine-specific RNA methylase IME4